MKWTLSKKLLVPTVFALVVINIGLFFVIQTIVKNFYFDTINENVVPIIKKEISSVLTAEDFFVVKGKRMQPSALFRQKLELTKKVLVDFIQEIKCKSNDFLYSIIG